MARVSRRVSLFACTTALAAALICPALAVDSWRFTVADPNPNDWLTYHGTYRSYHFSPLDQIKTDNVRQLRVAWMHQPGHVTRGLQSMPLVADGILYYAGSDGRVFALDGATGEVKWSYRPRLDEDLVAAQTGSLSNRGIALGLDKVYIGTVDGRVIALEMQSGKVAWDTRLIDSGKSAVSFTGAPLFVRGKVIIGAQDGERPWHGPIYGLDARTGEKKWEFLTVAGSEGSGASGSGESSRESWRASWRESWRAGSGGWMPGTYDVKTNTVWWGTGTGPRLGDNSTTASVIGLDPDSGKLKFHHQEIPHDALGHDIWGFDSSAGEFLLLERDGRDLAVHPNTSGFVFVYDRKDAKIANVWRLAQNINFVSDIDAKTGALKGRRDMGDSAEGVRKNLCPALAGGLSWNAGAYSPRTGLYYKVGQEWCMDLGMTPNLKPMAQPDIGANITWRDPDGGKAYGHVDARDPITGAKSWEIRFPEPPLASLLATGGDLLFVPDSRGLLHAYDARNGEELWSHNNGIGHTGGIISYSANAKQYIAVMTGWGSPAGDGFAALFGSNYVNMPQDAGTLVVFALPDAW